MIARRPAAFPLHPTFLAGCLLLLASCGEDPAGPGYPVLTITLTPAALSLSIGSSDQLVIGFETDTAGLGVDTIAVRWSSSDETIATVTSAGLVTAVGLGDATISVEIGGSTGSALIQTGLAFTSLSAGQAHTCGLVVGGEVFCWGDNGRGQLGDGTKRASTSPVRVGLAGRYLAVTAGLDHTCGLAENGSVFCWGAGGVGQRGDGTADDASLPTPIASDLVFTYLSAGDNHTCGITADESLRCWGSNGFGQLGDNSLTNRLAPTAALATDGFRAVDAGRDHSCAVGVSGTGYCWGRNDDAQLGSGTPSGPVRVPTAVGPLITFRILLAAAGPFTCGISLNRWAYCWGRGDDGQLGTGTTQEANGVTLDQTIPFASLDLGTFHACGTTVEFRTYCWGTSRLGILGVRSAAIPLEIPIALSRITTGAFHTCGIGRDDRRAFCWGGNDHGQLGSGSAAPSDVPQLVALQIQTP
ncbi:MAG TPA: Ig-like domain-containing protein [Gemmatimonadales bacterium]